MSRRIGPILAVLTLGASLAAQGAVVTGRQDGGPSAPSPPPRRGGPSTPQGAAVPPPALPRDRARGARPVYATPPDPLGLVTDAPDASGCPSATTGASVRTAGAYTWRDWWADHGTTLVLGEPPRAATTSSSRWLTGRGRRDGAPWTPDTRLVREWIAPALLALVDDEDPLVAAAAIRSLARGTPRALAAPLARVLAPHLLHADERVGAEAALALGLLGARGDEPRLQAIAAGRAPWAAGASRRAHAALALGLLDTETAVAPLVTLARDRAAPVDARAGAILGLGALVEARSDVVTGMFVGLLRDRTLDARLAALAAEALGATRAAVALAPLLEAVTDEGRDPRVRVAAALALGDAARLEPPVVLDAMLALASGASDPSTRRATLVSLARLGARTPPGPAHRDVLERIEATLRDALGAPAPDDRAWAALGGALLARAHGEAAVRLLPSLRTRWDRERSASPRSALALALGLAGDARDVPALRARLDEPTGDVAGWAAVGLGLLRDDPSRPALRALARDRAATTATRDRAALALALLDDPVARTWLLETLARRRAPASTPAARLVVSRLDGPAVVEMLADRAHDLEVPRGTRRWATSGLGILAEGPSAWNAGLRARTRTVRGLPVVAAARDPF